MTSIEGFTEDEISAVKMALTWSIHQAHLWGKSTTALASALAKVERA